MATAPIRAASATLICGPLDMNGTDNMSTPYPPATDIGIDSTRRHQIFPCMSEEQFAVLARHGERRRFRAGTILFQQGQRHSPMFVIISGSVEVSRAGPLGSHVVATHGPGSFSGEAGTLAGCASSATGRRDRLRAAGDRRGSAAHARHHRG